jgi:hypothetical protein
MKKIFVGPIEIAGYYSNLSKGLKELGADCEYYTFDVHPFNYGDNLNTPTLLKFSRFFKSKIKFQGRKFQNKLFLVLSELFSSLFAIYAILKYDVFIFGFGQSLLRNNWDLPIYRFLKKTVIINIGHGSDARPPYLDGSYQSKDGLVKYSIGDLMQETRYKKNKILFVEKYATYIIGMPFSTSQFASKKFINFLILGVPFQDRFNYVNKDPQEIYDQSKKEFKILHAPSHPAAKGSTLIVAAINNLKSKGYNIELTLLHGKDNIQVIDEIVKSDFIVDQVYSDTPMAGLVTEAAWYGKPSVVGGYGFQYLKQFVPFEMWPPSKICTPNNLESSIESLLINSTERREIGLEAQKFVHEKWNIKEVASRFLKIIEGDIPNEWWIQPDSVIYLEGACQNIERTKENISQLIEKYGIEALHLSHSPKLEKEVYQFVQKNQSNYA